MRPARLYDYSLEVFGRGRLGVTGAERDVAVTLQPAGRGDTTSLEQTVEATVANLLEVQVDSATQDKVHRVVMKGVMADKGYHSNATMTGLTAMAGRSYVSEPARGKRNWKGRAGARQAVYGNRRRIRGRRGQSLMRRRGEVLERSLAHCYETGGMRRTHLRGRGNILKRLAIHACGFSPALVMRSVLGVGKPRQLQDRARAALSGLISVVLRALEVLRRLMGADRFLPGLAPAIAARPGALRGIIIRH